MKIALIANPYAGGHKSQHLTPIVKKSLRARHLDFDLFLTRHGAHVDSIIRSMKLSEYDALVAMGGDGANFKMLNAVLRYHPQDPLPPLGVIPAGRGNSFARDLHLLTPQQGIDAIVARETRLVDVCCFTQNSECYYFVNLMGLGFVTDVAATAARFRRLGDLSYILGVWRQLYRLNFYDLRMEIDGVTFGGKNCFVEVCNSRYTGGEMLMAPQAQIDDGHFDVVMIEPLSRISLLCAFPQIFQGRHVDHARVRVLRGSSALIHTQPEKQLLPDGELFGHTPTHIKVLPQRVRYFHLAPRS